MSNETVSLEKGARVDLTKSHAGLKMACVGLGWDVATAGNATFDLDGFAISLKGGKFTAKEDITFFGNLTGRGVKHSGDNLTGVGDGDDETIIVDLANVPADVDQILMAVNIYQADSKKQNFGQVNNAFIRVYDGDSKEELAKYDLSENYSAFNAVVMGKLYRHEGEWKFQAIGEGKNGDINAIAQSYR